MNKAVYKWGTCGACYTPFQTKLSTASSVDMCNWFVTDCGIGCISYGIVEGTTGGNQSAVMCRHWPDYRWFTCCELSTLCCNTIDWPDCFCVKALLAPLIVCVIQHMFRGLDLYSLASHNGRSGSRWSTTTVVDRNLFDVWKFTYKQWPTIKLQH